MMSKTSVSRITLGLQVISASAACWAASFKLYEDAGIAKIELFLPAAVSSGALQISSGFETGNSVRNNDVSIR